MIKSGSTKSKSTKSKSYENIVLRLLWMKEMMNKDRDAFSTVSKKISTYL
jgi:hypothetical protein